MKKIKVSLVSLGSLKHPVDFSSLTAWESDLISIQYGASIGHLPNADGDDWERTSAQLRTLIQVDPGADFTVGLINSPLEDNYYMRRLEGRVAVLSLYEMADIVSASNFSVENFILRNVYELAVLYAANLKLIPSDAYSWTHDDVRGCLFDMNSNKSDIVFSMNQPVLCAACAARVSSKQVHVEFLPRLDRELARIRKSLYFRMTDWVRVHPLLALFFTGLSGVFLNILASIIFEKLKSAFSWIS